MTKSLQNPFEVPARTRLILVANDADAQAAYEAYCGGAMAYIECSFGTKSFRPDTRRGKRKKGPLYLWDHHGDRHAERSAFVQAYQQFGCLREGQHRTIVVTGFPDEDACGAAAAGLGIIPHHSFYDSFYGPGSRVSEAYRLRYGRDLTAVAELVERVDLDPNCALELDDTVIGRQLLAWREQGSPADDIAAWWGGIDRLRAVLTYQSDVMFDAAEESRTDRLEEVHSAPYFAADDFAAVDLSAYGRNSAYYREWMREFRGLVVLVGNAFGRGSLTFVVRDVDTGRKLFGPKGLLEIYQMLPAKLGRCGGRELIGGADRDREFNFEDATEAAVALAGLARKS